MVIKIPSYGWLMNQEAPLQKRMTGSFLTHWFSRVKLIWHGRGLMNLKPVWLLTKNVNMFHEHANLPLGCMSREARPQDPSMCPLSELWSGLSGVSELFLICSLGFHLPSP